MNLALKTRDDFDRAGFIVYAIENTVNGKLYVGCTSKGLSARLAGHLHTAKYSKDTRRPLYNAFRKNGADSFRAFGLEVCASRDDMLLAESWWISQMGTHNKAAGYNATLGGDGVFGLVVSDETRAKLSLAAKGQTPVHVRVKELGIRSTGFTGKHTDESKQKMRDAKAGRKHPPDCNHCKFMRESGRKK